MTPRLASLSLVFIFLAYSPAVCAVPAPPTQTNTTHRSEPDTAHSSWSKEEIFTFVGVLIATTGVVITLVLLLFKGATVAVLSLQM
jgi:hypothetical protein